MTTNRSLYKKTLQRNYRSDDWDACRSKNTKRRYKQKQKTAAKRILNKELK